MSLCCPDGLTIPDEAYESGSLPSPDSGLLARFRAKWKKEPVLARKSPFDWKYSGHEVAVKEVEKIAVSLARQTGQDEGEKIQHLFQKMGILLVKGNSALFTNRIPTFPETEIDGEL